MKKIPMRMCVVTREKLPKMELIRVVNTEEGFVVDETGKVNGHGVYLKKDIEVVEKARKTKCLNKVFETTVPDNIYDELVEVLKNETK